MNSLTEVHGWLVQVFGWRFVNLGAAIDVAPQDNPTNEPVPDLIVLGQDESQFTSNPRAQDLLLVVEIADTSLNFDLTVKAALYARAGVSEYWVLDVSGRRLLVHRNPRSGTYANAHLNSVQRVAAHAIQVIAIKRLRLGMELARPVHGRW